MTLLLDIGNSRVKWRYPSSVDDTHRGSSEHDGRSLPASLAAASGSWPKPRSVLVASVAGTPMKAAVGRWARELWELDAEWVEVTAHRCGVTCGYDEPSQLGVDRWMAVIGARARHPGSVCVVDCGTAVTVDAVSWQGLHMGGAIFPGVRLMRLSLAGNTWGLPEVDCPAGDEVLGRSTKQCILFGTLRAVASSVNSLRAYVETQLGGDTEFFLTGGDAGRVGRLLDGEYSLVPELVLDGLEVVGAV